MIPISSERAGLVLACLLVFSAVAPGTVAADDESSVVDDFVSGASNAVDAVRSWVSGKVSRLSASIGGDDGLTPRESAEEVTTTFNRESDALVDYANERIASSRNKTDFDVIKVRWAKAGETNAVRYVVADVNSTTGDFDNVSMVEDTDREVDHRVTLRDHAVDKAPDELDRFVDRFVDEDRDVEQGYVARLAAEYGPDVETTLVET